MKHNADLQILIVTGYSGAGKSTVLRALEDNDFFCVDNLPVALLDPLYELLRQSKINARRIALGIDVRGGHSIDVLIHELAVCKTIFAHVKVFFLTSSSRVLARRFQETRRKHPLARMGTLSDAIDREKALLRPLGEIADIVLDTDQLTIHQLRSFVRNSFVPESEQKVIVSLVSFGFKYGVPEESNFVYDIRSLPNPYFITELRSLKGTDPQVVTYLFEHQQVVEYWDKLLDFVRFSLEKSKQEGRFFVKIAIGCTGGRHRSVALVERLAQMLKAQAHVVVDHRDINHDDYRSLLDSRAKLNSKEGV